MVSQFNLQKVSSQQYRAAEEAYWQHGQLKYHTAIICSLRRSIALLKPKRILAAKAHGQPHFRAVQFMVKG